MVAVRKIQTVYYEDGDALWLHILPRQSAREAMTDHDFYVRYDSQEQEEIVGFRILDFSQSVGESTNQGQELAGNALTCDKFK